jgi:pyruvate,water dikinase
VPSGRQGQGSATEHGGLGGIAVSEQHVLGLQEVDEMQVAVVGGKGAHLGALSRIEGIRVPAGFCVTTDAFRRIMAEAPSIDDRLAISPILSPSANRSAASSRSRSRRCCSAGVYPPRCAYLMPPVIRRQPADVITRSLRVQPE